MSHRTRLRLVTRTLGFRLIDQERIYIEHFSKTDQKSWLFCDYAESEQEITPSPEPKTISLSSVKLEISLADIYNKVNFEELAD
ncbi:MAG: hypothetical protein F6K47_38175 [Symploca sp. SIO2E6]|nr:hypothetical protein [Symploca sp. SIO2E6]